VFFLCFGLAQFFSKKCVVDATYDFWGCLQNCVPSNDTTHCAEGEVGIDRGKGVALTYGVSALFSFVAGFVMLTRFLLSISHRRKFYPKLVSCLIFTDTLFALNLLIFSLFRLEIGSGYNQNWMFGMEAGIGFSVASSIAGWNIVLIFNVLLIVTQQSNYYHL
jgi:hypothetical protein